MKAKTLIRKYPLIQGILAGCVQMKMRGKSYRECKEYFDSFAVQYYPENSPKFVSRQVLWRLVKEKEKENMRIAGYIFCEGCGKYQPSIEMQNYSARDDDGVLHDFGELCLSCRLKARGIEQGYLNPDGTPTGKQRPDPFNMKDWFEAVVGLGSRKKDKRKGLCDPRTWQ
jgi:hypothetical protein